MRNLRLWHQYISLFFGPAIFFFAFTGFLQVAHFHEPLPGSTYKPPAWIVAITSLHQHQMVIEHRDAANRDGGARKPQVDDAKKAPPPFPPFKPFVVFLSWGLMASSLLGMAIGLTTPSSRRMSLILIAAGTLIPIALILA